jgi:cell wall-associated NlpC family hydrolase
VKPQTNMGMGFIALVVAGLLAYSTLKNKSLTDTVFLREGAATEGTASTGEEAGVEVAAGSPKGTYPQKIQEMIGFANSISGKYDYAWGGGHQTIGQPSAGGLNGPGGRTVTGFDCSGAVSGVLHAAGLLSAPETSGQLEKWGVSGKGKYHTVYCNADHTFMNIAGKWFGTGHIGKGGGGPEWGNHDQTVTYEARHWPGL